MDREQAGAVREWARAQGFEVSDRGRISAAVLTAYEQRGANARPGARPEVTAEAGEAPKGRIVVADPFAVEAAS